MRRSAAAGRQCASIAAASRCMLRARARLSIAMALRPRVPEVPQARLYTAPRQPAGQMLRYALIASDWPTDAAIICACCWINRSMKLCPIEDGLEPEPPDAGVVIVTCEPSEYVMVVVEEPSWLVTVWLVSPANGSL